MSTLFYELAHNVDIQERVHQEIVEVLDKFDNQFSYEALQDMNYLVCAIYGNFCILNVFVEHAFQRTVWLNM